MSISIRGIRIEAIQLKPNDKGEFQIETSEYSLISSADKVLAKQEIGGYKGMKLEPSPETKAALLAFTQSYTKDVQTLLGLNE